LHIVHLFKDLNQAMCAILGTALLHIHLKELFGLCHRGQLQASSFSFTQRNAEILYEVLHVEVRFKIPLQDLGTPLDKLARACRTFAQKIYHLL